MHLNLGPPVLLDTKSVVNYAADRRTASLSESDAVMCHNYQLVVFAVEFNLRHYNCIPGMSCLL